MIAAVTQIKTTNFILTFSAALNEGPTLYSYCFDDYRSYITAVCLKVSAATAQLLLACKVKADPNSAALKR